MLLVTETCNNSGFEWSCQLHVTVSATANQHSAKGFTMVSKLPFRIFTPKHLCFRPCAVDLKHQSGLWTAEYDWGSQQYILRYAKTKFKNALTKCFEEIVPPQELSDKMPAIGCQESHWSGDLIDMLRSRSHILIVKMVMIFNRFFAWNVFSDSKFHLVYFFLKCQSQSSSNLKFHLEVRDQFDDPKHPF